MSTSLLYHAFGILAINTFELGMKMAPLYSKMPIMDLTSARVVAPKGLCAEVQS
jgi:hypothetical protein